MARDPTCSSTSAGRSAHPRTCRGPAGADTWTWLPSKTPTSTCVGRTSPTRATNSFFHQRDTSRTFRSWTCCSAAAPRRPRRGATAMVFGSGPALVIAPHPDDEVLGVGGTIARLAAEGRDVFVVIATKGGPPLFDEAFIE